jgi:hypothetical protein
LAQFGDGHLSNSPSDAPVKILESTEEKKKENIIREVDTAMQALEQAMLGTGENWLGTMGNPDEPSQRDGVEYDFGSDGDHGDEPIKVETDGQAKVKIDIRKKKAGLEGFKHKRAVKLKTRKNRVVITESELATEGLSENTGGMNVNRMADGDSGTMKQEVLNIHTGELTAEKEVNTKRRGDPQLSGLGLQNLKGSEVRPDEVSPKKEDIIVVEDLLESQQGLGPK